MNRTIALVIGKATLGAGLVLGFAAAPHGVAHAGTGYDAYAFEVGDDNGDGVITEDESGFDCRTMGNLVCGEGNSQSVPAGNYSDPNYWLGAIYCPPAGTPAR